jgi:hypothetical protein
LSFQAHLRTPMRISPNFQIKAAGRQSRPASGPFIRRRVRGEDFRFQPSTFRCNLSPVL